MPKSKTPPTRTPLPPSPRGGAKKPKAKKTTPKKVTTTLSLAEVDALMGNKSTHKIGRPSIYTDALGARINDLIASGMSLRQVCALPNMPNRATVNRWLEDPERAAFATNHAHAREAQADTVHDGMKEIEALLLRGKIPSDVARVVLGSQQWRAERLAPKKYGQKIGLGQAEGFAPVSVEIKNYGGLKPGVVSPTAGQAGAGVSA